MNFIQKEVSLFLSAETVQIRKLAHVIGTLVVTKAVVRPHNPSPLSCITAPEDHLPTPVTVLSSQSAAFPKGSGQLAMVERSPSGQ